MNRMKQALLGLASFLFSAGPWTGSGRAQEADTTFWDTNGSVHAVATFGNMIYLGGGSRSSSGRAERPSLSTRPPVSSLRFPR